MKQGMDGRSDFDGTGGRELRLVHQVLVDFDSSSTTFSDTPAAIESRSVSNSSEPRANTIGRERKRDVHNKGLTSSRVTGGKDSFDVRVILSVRSFDVAATVLFETERLDRRFLGTEESESEDDTAENESAECERIAAN